MSPASRDILEVEDVRVHYALARKTPFSRGVGFNAVDGVSFNVQRKTTFGIVGESGCGKSSLALALAQLVKIGSGRISFNGRSLATASGAQLKAFRQGVQLIFQDPFSSLNPRKTVEHTIQRPLRQLTDLTEAEIRSQTDDILALVGIRPDQKKLYPHQFSGGQRQRIAIARALAVRPSLVICDEPTSALDVAIQAQILNLLVKLQRDLNLSYLFISHDLGIIQRMSDRVGVMYLGQFVEVASRHELFARPLHPYSHALLSSAPIQLPSQRGTRARIRLSGQPPSPISPPQGCRFHTRCQFADDVCRRQVPALRQLGAERSVACHLAHDTPQGPVGPAGMMP